MFCEKICPLHEHPINAVLHIIAVIVLIYGLWRNSWKLIIFALMIGLFGHLIQFLSKTKRKRRK